MTMITAYGFDNYDTLAEFLDLEPEWTVFVAVGPSSIETTGGRFGGGALFPNQNSSNAQWGAKLTFTSAQPTTLFFGTSINSQILDVGTEIGFLLFREDDNEHLRLRHNVVTGNIEVFILGITAGDFFMSDSQWHRLEIKLVVDDAAGEVTIRLDGNEVFTDSGIDTQAGSNSWTNNIAFVSEAGKPDNLYDDVTCNDDQGSFNNDWLGDIRIETLRPDGAGFVTDFTPSTGANWENVDDSPGPDDDSTYNESSTGTDQDLYTITDLVGVVADVKATVIRATARKDDGGSRTIELLSRTGGVTDVGATQTLLTSYSNFQEIHEVDPFTGVAWTQSGIDGAEIGMENN